MKARGSGGSAKRLPVACAALASMSTLPGCGAVSAVGGAVHSTAEAIATVVKDAVREADGSPAEDGEGGPGHGGR